jgi:Ca-activated chloride channel family protein
VKIYPIGIGADPEDSGTRAPGVNPSLDLDEPALKAIAEATGGQYFRARDGKELQAIKDTLDQLEPVAQQPTQARPAQACISGPWRWPCC